MKNILDVISEVPAFGGLPVEQLEAIRDISVHRRFGRGEIIFSDGEEGKGFFVVADGAVKVFKVSPDGKEQILHILQRGEPFGQVAVFAGRSFPASAQAIAKTDVLFFPRSAFVDLLSANPSLALNMLAVLSKRLREFTVQVEHLSLKEVPARLAAYLIQLSEEQGGAERVRLNISKGQLASFIGIIPETLSRMFAKMTAQNLIEMDGRYIRLLDRDGLEAFAETGKYV